MRRISCDPKPKMPEEPEQDGPSSEDSLEDVEAHHCPICLNRPRRSDRAVPDCCGHVFCSACILRWAQMVQSCPVDRRPFRAIHLQEGVKLLVDTQRQSDTGRSSGDLEETQKETILTRKPHAQTSGWLDERVRGKKKGIKQSCRSLLIGHQLSFRHSGQEAAVGILNCVITESLDVCVEEGDIQWRRLMRKDLRIPEFPPEPVRTTLMPRRSHTRLRFSVISSNQPFSAASVPQGHVCAVTCPKGEEKKGSSRASGSKSCKPGEAVGTRRSSRLTQVPDSSAQTTDPEPSCPTYPSSPQNSHGSHSPSWGNGTETEAAEKDGDDEESEVVNHKVDEDTEDGQSEEPEAEVEACLSSHQLDDNQEPDDKGQNMDTETWMSSYEDQCVSPDASDQVDESTNISNSIDEDNPIHSHNDIGLCEPTLSEAQVCDPPESDQDCPSPSQPAPLDVLDEPTSAEILEDQNPEPDTTVEINEQESSSICPSDQKPDVPEDCADRSPGDNTDPCPMECDSPASESEPQADIPQISHPEVQKKDGRPRRSRFHSAATTWSPSRESGRSRSPVWEHRSRSPSRRHERKHEEKRNRSHERRRRSSSRSRDRPGRRSPSRDPSDPGGSPRRRSWTGRDGWRDKGSVCNSNRSEKPDTKAAAVPNDNPDWVRERERTWTEPRREETGPDRSAHRSSGQYGESADNWRQRGNSSGTSDGSDPHSRFNEGWAGGKRKDPETEPALDRSGWSSASSWAIRRTLPADVQNYYSRRERGGWSRQEDEHSTSKTSLPDSPQTAPVLCQPVAVPVSQPLPVMNFPIRPMLPPAAFAAPLPPPPVVLRPPGPLLQSLLPPPPPPPPVLQVPPESFPPQVLSGFPGHGRVTFKVPTTKAAPGLVRPVGTAIVAQPSSTTSQSVSQSRVQADSSKKEKKLQIQERAVSEVKAAIKPFYQKNEINKDEYKEIVRKAVDKVCHSKSGEVNASKVAMLVKAYVDKYKHSRRNRAEKS